MWFLERDNCRPRFRVHLSIRPTERFVEKMLHHLDSHLCNGYLTKGGLKAGYLQERRCCSKSVDCCSYARTMKQSKPDRRPQAWMVRNEAQCKAGPG